MRFLSVASSLLSFFQAVCYVLVFITIFSYPSNAWGSFVCMCHILIYSPIRSQHSKRVRYWNSSQSVMRVRATNASNLRFVITKKCNMRLCFSLIKQSRINLFFFCLISWTQFALSCWDILSNWVINLISVYVWVSERTNIS